MSFAPHQVPFRHVVAAALQHPQIRKAVEAQAKLVADQAELTKEREQVQRDAAQLLAVPDEVVVQANVKIMSLTRRINQIDAGLAEMNRSFNKLIDDNRAKFLEAQVKHVAEARTALAAAIDQNEAAVAELSKQLEGEKYLQHSPYPRGRGWRTRLNLLPLRATTDHVAVDYVFEQMRKWAEPREQPLDGQPLLPRQGMFVGSR
jgi:hypothetical protein